MTFIFEWHNCENCTTWPWHIFWRSTILNFDIFQTVRASAKCVGDICRFWHLPSNGEITKIVQRELDLLSEGRKVKNVLYIYIYIYISEMVRASTKMCGSFFSRFWYLPWCHRMESWHKMDYVTLIYYWRWTSLNLYISDTVRANA